MPKDTSEPAATVTVYENGPLLVRGDFALRTALGAAVDPGRDTVALCRCGKSSIKPFCDGTHKAIGWLAGAERDPRPGAEPDPRSGAEPDPTPHRGAEDGAGRRPSSDGSGTDGL